MKLNKNMKLNVKEDARNEFKSSFHFKTALKELGAMLNKVPRDESVEIFFGFDDNGLLIGMAKRKDDNEDIDILLRELSIYGVLLEKEEYPKNAFSIKATASDAAIIVDGKLPIRHGSSSYDNVRNESDYKDILKIKNINLGELYDKTYNPSDFSKLEEYIARKGYNTTMLQLLIKANVVVKIKNKSWLTGWSVFLTDDSPLSLIIDGKEEKGPLFTLFEKAIEFSNKIAVQEEFLIDSRRMRIEENITNWQEVIREIISNMFCHSHFKLLDNSMWIELNQNEIIFKNRIIDGMKLKESIKNMEVPIKHHNAVIATMLRLMNLLEGKGIGFDRLFKAKPFVGFEVTNSEIKVKLGGKYE